MIRSRSFVAATALAVALFGQSVLAQQGTTPSAPPATSPAPAEHPKGVNKRLEKMAEELGLTDAQKDQIKPILQASRQQSKAVHQDTTLTDDQKKAKEKEIHQDTNKKILALLTPEQKEKLAQLKHHKKTAQ